MTVSGEGKFSDFVSETEAPLVWRNLTFGLKSYCQENGFSDVVLGLSGGMDSALVAVLACDALGAKHVHCLMMPSEYTSRESIAITRKMQQMNGFNYKEVPISQLVKAQTDALSGVLLTEILKPVVLQNMQARARGMLLMNYSNQTGFLPLACGNKTEIMLGYCTLYGDTCGGISPLGELYKTDVYTLANWRNKQSKVFPKAVITREPTAELAPEQQDKKELGNLDYGLLDFLLAAMESPSFDKEEACLLTYSAEQIDKVERLKKINAFKAKQMPPALATRQNEK